MPFGMPFFGLLSYISTKKKKTIKMYVGYNSLNVTT